MCSRSKIVLCNSSCVMEDIFWFCCIVICFPFNFFCLVIWVLKYSLLLKVKIPNLSWCSNGAKRFLLTKEIFYKKVKDLISALKHNAFSLSYTQRSQWTWNSCDARTSSVVAITNLVKAVTEMVCFYVDFLLCLRVNESNSCRYYWRHFDCHFIVLSIKVMKSRCAGQPASYDLFVWQSFLVDNMYLRFREHTYFAELVCVHFAFISHKQLME